MWLTLRNMPGLTFRLPPQPVRRGAALGCVFATLLVSASAIGSWEEAAGGAEPRATRPAARQQVALRAGEGDAALAVSRSGDRWSTAYSRQEYQAHQRTLAGEYVGTGIAVVRAADGRIEVSEVHVGSPAARAGVRPGDRLRTIDGTTLTGRPVTDAVSRLRGSDRPEQAGPGSSVVLGLARDGRRFAVEVERARLTEETVTVRRDAPGVTRVHVSSFTRGSAELLRAAVGGAPESDGILLDLRGNAGGLLTEAADAASIFLDGGLVATYDVYGSQRALHAAAGVATARPLVVLVDAGTTSSAELLTGALQDRNRAVIVGSPTFGKGTVQMPRTQPDGSVAELTVGHYATPSGRVVDEGAGIVPDLVVDPGEDAERKGRTVLGVLASGV